MYFLGVSPMFHARAGLGDKVVAALCAVAAVPKTGGCGGSGGRSASIGVGGSLPCRLACSGVPALASGLLRGLEAELAACDSQSLHPSAWTHALS